MNQRTSQTLESLFSLEGRVGIITGASSGIGAGIAEVLTAAGATIYDLSLQANTERKNPQLVAKEVDITDSSRLKELVDEIGSDQGLDFLINNAGITKRVKAQDVDSDWWDQIHQVNVDALFCGSQCAYPYLKASEHVGRIVNITSMAAYMGFREVVPYCSTKSSVIGITRGLAVEWAQDNILVNSISPGWFQSKMHQQVVDQEREQRILRKIALGRYGQLCDIAHMALFLVSDASTYITGQDFSVDGGARALGY